MGGKKRRTWENCRIVVGSDFQRSQWTKKWQGLSESLPSLPLFWPPKSKDFSSASPHVAAFPILKVINCFSNKMALNYHLCAPVRLCRCLGEHCINFLCDCASNNGL